MEYVKKLKGFNEKKYHFSMEEEIKKYILLFIMAGLTGYVIEVITFLVQDGVLLNRGFLYGPFLPIYGWGTVFIVFFLKQFKNHPVFIFLLSMLLSAILEYITGAVMLYIWNERLWDYTGMFMNLHGFICLKTSLQFGLAGLFVIYFLEPFVSYLLSRAPRRYINYIIILFFCFYFSDNILSNLFRNL